MAGGRLAYYVAHGQHVLAILHYGYIASATMTPMLREARLCIVEPRQQQGNCDPWSMRTCFESMFTQYVVFCYVFVIKCTREFRDVGLEDVGFENNSLWTRKLKVWGLHT